MRFRRDTRAHEWLYDAGRADLAEDGLITAQGAARAGACSHPARPSSSVRRARSASAWRPG